MKPNIKIQGINYKLLGRITRCKFECTLDLSNIVGVTTQSMNKKLSKRFPKVEWDLSGVVKITVTGLSECHSNDTFDSNRGKYLARTRAIAKLYKLVSKIISAIKKEMHKSYVDLRELQDCSLNIVGACKELEIKLK